MSAKDTKEAVEIRFDESGNTLKVQPWPLKRIHGKGETFIDDGIMYLVVDSDVTFGKHGGAMAEHVVRVLNRLTQKD